MAITYPINIQTDRFTVYSTTTNAPLLDGNGRPMINVKWGSKDTSQMISNLSPDIKWLINVTELRPSYDRWTERLEKTTTYDVGNETATEGWTVIALTQGEIDTNTPANFETSGGILIGTSQSAQYNFIHINSLIDLGNIQGPTGITIKDIYGDPHTLTVGDYKTMISDYADHCYSLFLATSGG